MKNLRITFLMRAPLALNHPWLHLDGLLAHLILFQQLKQDYYLLPTFQVVAGWEVLQGILDFRDGVPCASASILDNSLLYTLHHFKRFERRHSASLRKKTVDQGSGALREWRLVTVYAPVDRVTFFARGSAEVIAELLKDVMAIGNDRRVGWGELRAPAIVEEIEEDCSIIYQGRAMRPIPADRLQHASEVVNLAWRPPYWSAENIAPCAPPGAEVVWKE